MWDAFWAFVREEIAEVRRAPAALGLFLLIGVGIGAGVTRWLDSERLQLAQERVNLAELKAEMAMGPPPPTKLPEAPMMMLMPGVSIRASILVATAISLILLAVGAYSLRLRSLRAHAQELLAAATQRSDRSAAELEMVTAAFNERKRAYALDVFRRHAGLRLHDDRVPRVTVRFVGYGEDYDIVQKIKTHVAVHLNWPVDVDGSNSPALLRATDEYKVVFDLGLTGNIFGEVAGAFSEGNLLGVPIGFQTFSERRDYENLIVKVLPSAGASMPIGFVSPASFLPASSAPASTPSQQLPSSPDRTSGDGETPA
jgi:hypothetical protein